MRARRALQRARVTFFAPFFGGASAAFFGGLLRVNFGTYTEAFILSGLLCFAAAVMVLFIGGGRRALRPAAATA
jgi:hypothetical protein